MKNNIVRRITVSAVVAAVYTALTLLMQPIAFGAAQIRLSEGLTMMAFVFPEAVPGLAIGCFLANLLGGGALADIIIGTLATLLAAFMSSRVKNIWIAGLFPVLLNTAMVAPVIVYYYMGGGSFWVYLGYMAIFALCEAFSVYAVGVPLVQAVSKVRLGMNNSDKARKDG